MDVKNTLARMDLFCQMSEEELSRAAGLCRDALLIRTYERGQLIVHNSGEGGQIHMVLSGILKGCVLNEDGEQFDYAFYPPGTIVGLMHLFLGDYTSDRSAQGITLICHRAARVLQIPALTFSKMMKEVPRLQNLAAEDIATMHQDMVHMANITHFNSAEKRTVHYLLYRAKQLDADEIPIRLTITDCASYLNLTRPVLSRTLHSLQRRGLVKMGSRALTILDRQALIDIIR